MMTIKQTVEIDFNESDLLDICKQAGFPDVRLYYDLSIMCDYTKIDVYLNKEPENWSGSVGSLISDIKKLKGIREVECETYIHKYTGYKEVKLVVRLVGILYHENGRMLS